ncbi:hypothetical protein [Paenibacillus beijingensis]|uniref:Nucleotidyltransferase family protein n=1 Tax=Paenibacillus beijingensis TaxID=1126833 RepID=A0A0D5NQK2_9BACL|nr:hypothetical protein [Paenibacillus beijingensis]AJY77183.1 hypothetical protein VN24_24805 [Paenibacillus beijingensis]
MDVRQQISEALAAAAAAGRAWGAQWVVGGSSGLLLRGLKLPAAPRDLDLYADEEDARALHRGLERYAVDVPAWSETDMYRSLLSHYVIHGVEVELVGGFIVTAKGCRYRAEVREVLRPYGENVRLLGRDVTIAPLAHEFWFNLLRAREDRCTLIGPALGREAESGRVLAEIERRNRFSPEAVAEARKWLEGMKAGAGN